MSPWRRISKRDFAKNCLKLTLRIGRRKKDKLYDELPLYQLREKFTTESGKAFLEKLIQSRSLMGHLDSLL